MSATAAPLPATAHAPPFADRLADWIAGEWDRWPLWLPVAFGAGIVGYFALLWEPGEAWFALPIAPLIAAILLWRVSRPASVACALLAAAALGFATGMAHARLVPPVPDLPRTAVIVRGTVSNVELLPEGRRITLEGARWGDAAPPPRDLRIRLRADDPARPAPGDTLSIRALIRAPSPPSYPGAWDFQRAAYFSGLAGSGFALGPATVTPGAESPVFAGLRAAIEARVRDVVPGAAGSVSAALLTGSQSGIPAEAMTAMRDSGLAHLLSVSGLHVAIVIGLGYGVARWGLALIPWVALRLDGKPAAAVIGLLLGGAYTLLTGSQVPMVRSFAMAALGTLALMTGRRVFSPRALALAAGVVMVAAPASLLGPSFQMSFAAVLALIACAEAMRAPAAHLRERGLPGRIALVVLGAAATSVVAAAATTPFGLHHFGRLQLYGVAANAVAVPLTSFIVMPAGMLALLLMPLGWDGPALTVMGWGTEAVIEVGRVVASWPGAALTAPPIPAWGMGLFALGLCWLCLWRLRWRWLGVPMMIMGLLSGFAADPPQIMVSSDARLIAVSTPGGVFVERASGGSRFIRDSWLRAWGEDGSRPLPAEGGPPEATCTREACILRPNPDGPAAVLLRPAARPSRREPAPPVRAEPHCGTAAVLLSAEPIRGRCRDTPGVDRFSVWRDGAHAIWLSPTGVRVLSDRAARGDRPWVPPVPVPRPRPGGEPAADRDSGGAVD